MGTSQEVISFSDLPFPLDPDHTDHPWLLVHQGNNLEKQTFYSMSTREYTRRRIPEFRNKTVSSTSIDGWLALIDTRDPPLSCTLVNVATKESIDLPRLAVNVPNPPKHYRCVLSKAPTDPGCLVLLHSKSEFFCCHIGDARFTRGSFRVGTNLDVIRDNLDANYAYAFTSFDGNIYAYLSKSGYIVSVGLRSGVVTFTVVVNGRGKLCRITWPSPSTSSRFTDYMVESCGELLMVHVIGFESREGGWYFRIFKVDFESNEDECAQLRTIGDRTIFLSDYGSMSSVYASDKIQKNAIYYTWYANVFVYDIEDMSHPLVKPCPAMRALPTALKSWVMM